MLLPRACGLLYSHLALFGVWKDGGREGKYGGSFGIVLVISFAVY